LKSQSGGGTLEVMASKKKSPKKSLQKRARSNGRKKRALGAKSAPPDLFENVHKTKIRVIGIGGGGGNIVSEIASKVNKLDFIGANTDSQALRELPRKVKSLAFGQDFTHGLGCGMDPDLGERAAKAEKEKIKKVLEGTDICILVSSLGGGTGSGAAPIFAEVAHEMRILTVGIFTMPFPFEGEKRTQIAQASLEKIKPSVNTYVIIPNQNIFRVVDSKSPLKAALSAVNKRLAATLEGFIDTLSTAGLINIDFADVRSVMEGRGRLGFINSAEAAGGAKAADAVKSALQNSLYDYGINGADRVLFNIVGDRNIKMQEAAFVSKAIFDHNPKARIIFGISCNNPRLKDKIRITLFAVGIGGDGLSKTEEQAKEKKSVKRKPRKIAIRQVGKQAEKPVDQTAEKSADTEPPTPERQRVRRSAMEVKKAVDEELRELEKKEREWDVPAFLRNKQ